MFQSTIFHSFWDDFLFSWVRAKQQINRLAVPLGSIEMNCVISECMIMKGQFYKGIIGK